MDHGHVFVPDKHKISALMGPKVQTKIDSYYILSICSSKKWSEILKKLANFFYNTYLGNYWWEAPVWICKGLLRHVTCCLSVQAAFSNFTL